MFIIEVPTLSLDKTYNSLQCPRWIKLRDCKYVIPFGDKALKVEQNKNKLILNCSEEEFYSAWFGYFDLGTDYSEIYYAVSKSNKKFKIPANRGFGIHLLNQDKFEMYIFCKLVEQLGYEKAGEILNRIAASYGVMHKQQMMEAGNVTWYEFPTPEKLVEALSKKNNPGPVNSFLLKLSKAIVNDGYEVSKSEKELCKLFVRGDKSAFPSEQIDETIEKNFHCSVEEFRDDILDGRAFDYSGVLYLYILHHILFKPKEVR